MISDHGGCTHVILSSILVLPGWTLISQAFGCQLAGNCSHVREILSANLHLVRIPTRVRIRTKKWNSRELDSRGEEKASGQCGARRSQAEDRTKTQKLSALQNAHRKPDKVPCAFWDVRMVLRISHRCACMCVRACTRAQMGVCVLVYLHMYLRTRVHDYPVCMGLYVRVCTCVHVRMHVHARVFMHVCILLCLRAMRTCGYARMRDHVLMCMSALRYASL